MASKDQGSRQPDPEDRYLFPARGTLADRQVRRIRLSRTRTLFQCTRCQGWFPPDEVGLLLDAVSHDVRQQPQCRRCRHAARVGKTGSKKTGSGKAGSESISPE